MPTNKETNSNIAIHFDGKEIQVKHDESMDLEVATGDRKDNRIRSDKSMHLDMDIRARQRQDSYAPGGKFIDIHFEEKNGPTSKSATEEPYGSDLHLTGRDFNARFAFGKNEVLNIMAKVSLQLRLILKCKIDSTSHPMLFRLKVD